MTSPGSGMNRNLSGNLSASGSLQASLSKDITASRKKLIDQGMQSLLTNIITDLKASDLPKHLQALHALQGLTKSRAGIVAIQGAFREAGGLPLLIHIVDSNNVGKDASSEQREATDAATEAFFYLTRNSPESRAAGVKAGAVAAFAGMIGPGTHLPASVFVLRALQAVTSPDPSGMATSELFASGGVHALVKLLGTLLEADEEFEDREMWMQEVLALLEPAAQRSRLVAHLLTAHVAILCRLLMISAEPLSLSLGLDIMEEMLTNGEERRTARRMADQGALAALLHAVGLKGLGSKAASILAKLVGGNLLLSAVLRGLLQPADVAALVRTAARGAKAEDVEAAGPAHLLGELLQEEVGPSQRPDAFNSYAPLMLRSVVMSCCVGACLGMQPIRAPLLWAASSTLGSLLLRNLPARNVTEVAIAAAQLLPHLPNAVELLQRADAVPALVAAFLEEHAHTDLDPIAGLEATSGVCNILRTFPEEADTPQSTSEMAAPFSEAGLLDGQLQSPNGSSSYGSITFHVAGHEFVALGWVLERASPAIARTLAAIPDASSAAVVIPDVAGLSPDRLYKLFGLAVEFAYSGNLAMDSSEALDLWAVAAVLQMEHLMRHCERLSEAELLIKPQHLQHALELAAQYPAAGDNLCRLCSRQLSQALSESKGISQAFEQIQTLAGPCREPLQIGFEALLRQRISKQRREEGNGTVPNLLFQAPTTSSTHNEHLEATGSFNDWMTGNGVGEDSQSLLTSKSPSLKQSSLKKPSLEFPRRESGSVSEIEPLPDSPPKPRSNK